MPSVQFGQNHVYSLVGGTPMDRYVKRLELQRQLPEPLVKLVLEPGPDYSLLQLMTSETDVPLDTQAEVIAEAVRQGNVINLEA